MPTGSGLCHFLCRLVHKFIRSVVSNEKEVATARCISGMVINRIPTATTPTHITLKYTCSCGNNISLGMP